MLQPETCDWREPLDYLPALTATGVDFTLLYSGMRTPYGGQFSILAMHPDTVLEGSDTGALEQQLTTDLPAYANAWLGYLGYGLKNRFEKLTQDDPSHIHLPDYRFVKYETVLVFDHDAKVVYVHRQGASNPLPDIAKKGGKNDVKIANLASDMTKAEYLGKVAHILEAVRGGVLYQANLTRKFTGEFSEKPDIAALFIKLAEVSPAPYSALIRWGDTAIISSSPEQFLRMDAAGNVETRPIKGSARRSADPAEDTRIRDALAASEKDRSENLMIVDLMRNDLARGCEVGSVKTESLFDISTYATVHHMASTVTGKRREAVSPLKLVTQCFPPGSMTGAPKIRAMELCSELEPRGRGVYSGAIGWFGGDGSVDLSVVIRTLVVQGNRFEFQVGGAIVHDSTPEGEWEETLVKARGLAKALGIDEDVLRAL